MSADTNVKRRAQTAPVASRGDVEFFEMPVKQILNRCTNQRMPFEWTINPYRGCEFGCTYCYARYTHEFLELGEPLDFERRIFVKLRAAEALFRTLGRTPLASGTIAIGTATDPYQPAERRYQITRSLLEVFARFSGLKLSVTTKSYLITRDLDLLQQINERSELSVNFSVITLNRKLQRILEPRAPRPSLRLRALSELSRAGIRCAVLLMPVIPGLTDSITCLAKVIEAARLCGASQVWWRSLYLKPAAARRFLPALSERFPQLASSLRAYYSRNVYAPPDYDAEIGQRIDSLRRRFGFAPETTRRVAAPAPAVEPHQLTLRLG